MGIFSHEASDDLAVSASFPDTNPFGLIVNGNTNDLSIHLANHGKKNYTLVSAAASFHDPEKYWATIKNTTTMKFGVPLISGANFSAPLNVHSEFRPSELGLTVWVNLQEQGSKDVQRITAMNQTVSIVESPTSLLDPSVWFLWLIVGAALLGGAYAAYQSFFPQKKGGVKRRTTTKVVVNDKKEDYPTVKPYEEEWIPAHHLKSRTSKLQRKTRVDGGASSGGEDLTSGGEGAVTSGAESAAEGSKARKRKGKK